MVKERKIRKQTSSNHEKVEKVIEKVAQKVRIVSHQNHLN